MALALERRLVFVEVPHAACATALAMSLGGLVRSLAAGCAAGAAACEDRAAVPFSEAYAAHDRLCADSVRTAAAANLQALRRVDTAFRTLVSELEPRRLTAGVRLQNAPRRRFSPGVGAAYLIGRGNGAAAAPDAGAARVRPSARPASLAIVNVAFRPYDDTRVSPGWDERVRWFAGAAVTPGPGAAAGLSLLLVRGLAVNAGAVLFAAGGSARDDESPPGTSPRARGGRIARRGFVGLSYTFR